MHPCTIFRALVEEMAYVWFDLFVALGIEHKALEVIRDRYPVDPDASLFEAIHLWLSEGGGGKRGDVVRKPSWQVLVDVLYYEMLEAKLAGTVAEQHFSAEDLEKYTKGGCLCDVMCVSENQWFNVFLLYLDRVKSLTNEPIPPGFEDYKDFTKLLLEIIDKLGPNSFPEFSFFLKGLYCPDGTRLVDDSYLTSQYSPEGLLIILLHNNLFSSQDLDLLITLMRGLGREDLLPLLHDYSSKVAVSYPAFKAVQDTERFFSLLVGLQPRVTELDLEGVCHIKQEMCEILGVEEAPYLLQFLGWKRQPDIVIQFQLHASLTGRLREAVVHDATKTLENFTMFEMDIRGSVFRYELDKIKRS